MPEGWGLSRASAGPARVGWRIWEQCRGRGGRAARFRGGGCLPRLGWGLWRGMRLDGGKGVLIRCLSMIGEGYRRGTGECGGPLTAERLARLTTAGGWFSLGNLEAVGT